MNARQFVNTVVSAGLERYPGARSTLYLFPKFLFPEFLKASRLKIVENPYGLAAVIYAIVFFLVFVVQAYFASINNVLVPEGVVLSQCFLADRNCLRFFLGDFANLVNYVVLVEAYCISGVFFLIYSANIDRLLMANDISVQLDLADPSPSAARGAYSILFVVFFVTIGSVFYVLDIQVYPPHWYMNDFVTNGLGLGEWTVETKLMPDQVWPLRAYYYYVFINFLLLLFVGFVGVAHFGLFKTAGAISSGLRRVHATCEAGELASLLDTRKISSWLAPLSTQILISKIFVLAIVLNMTSWKMWEGSAGTVQDVSIVIMVIVGIWVVTLPRYFVQYHLFRIRQKCGIDEYRDIRMSWLLGASALVDLGLLTIAAKVLFTAESIFEMIGGALAGG